MTTATSPSSKSKKSRDRDRDRDKDRERGRDRDRTYKDKERDGGRSGDRGRHREKKSLTPTPMSNHRAAPLVKTKSLDLSYTFYDDRTSSVEGDQSEKLHFISSMNRYLTVLDVFSISKFEAFHFNIWKRKVVPSKSGLSCSVIATSDMYCLFSELQIVNLDSSLSTPNLSTGSNSKESLNSTSPSAQGKP